MLRLVPAAANCPTAAERLTTRPGCGRRHDRVGEIELRLLDLRVRLRQRRRGAGALGVQRRDLPLSGRQRRLGRLHRRLLLAQRRGVLLGVLDGSRAALGELVVARRLLLGEGERGLGRLDLGLALFDLGLLNLKLSVDAVDVGLRRRRLRLGRGERDAVVAIVDAGDHVARRDVLVVGDRNFGDEARRLGGDGELTRGDEGVVRRFGNARHSPSRRSRPPRPRRRRQAQRPKSAVRRPGRALGASPVGSGGAPSSTSASAGAARRPRARRRLERGGAIPRRRLRTVDGARPRLPATPPRANSHRAYSSATNSDIPASNVCGGNPAGRTSTKRNGFVSIYIGMQGALCQGPTARRLGAFTGR